MKTPSIIIRAYYLLILAELLMMPFAILSAEYALIYPVKASLFSYLALLISSAGMFMRLFSIPKSAGANLIRWRNKRVFEHIDVLKGSCIVWSGLALYSLNPVYGVMVALGWIIYFRLAKIYGHIPELHTPIEVRRKSRAIRNNNLFFLLIITCFYFADLYRDFTVWNHVIFRTWPTLFYLLGVFSISANLIFIAIKKSRDRKRRERRDD